MTTNIFETAESVGIRHVRAELTLTNHEVAIALAKRAVLPVLAAFADDLTAEAARLRMMFKGRAVSGV
nr:hypothetical protein [uncultured Dongia sp.]